MRIKRIFEEGITKTSISPSIYPEDISVEDQEQDIKEIFSEFLADQKYSTMTNRCAEVEDIGKYFILEIYGGVDVDNASSVKDLRYLIKRNLEAMEVLKRLEVCFKRLDYLRYFWTVYTIEEGFKIEISKKYSRHY